MNCDFCCSNNLYKAYKPIGSLLDTYVFICKICGLSQSSKTTKKNLSKKKELAAVLIGEILDMEKVLEF